MDARATRLQHLGDRICIMGPSNSGKSTLAEAIGRKQTLPVVHLDQLRHLPHTDWQERPDEEFAALHDEAIRGDRWVMEGNYSHLLPQRLAQATGLILLDASALASLLRYVRRSLNRSDSRVGGLEGGLDSVKFERLHYIAATTRSNRLRYRSMLETLPVPWVYIRSMRELQTCYTAWQLSRRTHGAARRRTSAAR